MTGFFNRISTKLRIFILCINFCVIFAIGAALDSIPLGAWPVWAVLVANIICAGVMGYGLEL